MAASLTQLTANFASTATSANTASVAPTANRPLYLVVNSVIGGGTPPVQPTITGAVTWALVSGGSNSFTDGATTTGRQTFWRGVSASPTSEAVTIDFGAESQTMIMWEVYDAEECELTVQSGTDSGTGTTASCTLSAWTDAGNLGFLSAVRTQGGGGTFTEEAGWTAFAQQSQAEIRMRSAWRTGQDTSPSMTNDVSANWRITAIEIDIAAAGADTLVQPVGLTNASGVPATSSGSLTSTLAGLSRITATIDGTEIDAVVVITKR